jgi:uncharacterized RDD family membrane protein YckC
MGLLVLAPWIGTRAALWAMAAAWIVWFGVSIFDPRRRALHDVIARTVLRK